MALVQFGNDITEIGELWVAEPVGEAQNPEAKGDIEKAHSVWNGYAAISPESGNQKTGICVNTYAAQVSCPDGANNASGYRCPFLGSGCYAERGHMARVTKNLNASGIKHRPSPEDVARAEAELIRLLASSGRWEKIRQKGNHFVRFHVVGDCVTPEAASILDDALRGLYVSSGERWTRNIWGYTRAWRDVPRSAWGDHVSVLASCDTARDVESATRRGWAATVIVPLKVAVEAVHGAKLRVAGLSVVLCPYEMKKRYDPSDPRAAKPVTCTSCRLCLREGMLRAKGLCVGFAAQGSSADVTASSLLPEQDIEVVGRTDPGQMHLDPRSGDRDYFDTLERSGYAGR